MYSNHFWILEISIQTRVFSNFINSQHQNCNKKAKEEKEERKKGRKG
jgi:hypothetical protein